MRKAILIIAVFLVLVLLSASAHGGLIVMIDTALVLASFAMIGVVLWLLHRLID